MIELTTDEGVSLQSLPPLGSDLDRLFGVLLSGCRMPLLLSMLDDLHSVVRVQRVHHVPEIRPIHASTFGELVRHTDCKLRVLYHHGVQALHRKLIVHWNVDEFDL